MLYIQSFVFNPFQENTYLITNEKKQCWIVDPGMYSPQETEHFIQYINDNQLNPVAIINTHAHLDHIFGVQSLIDKYNIPFLLHEKELPVLKNGKASAAMFGIDLQAIPVPTAYIIESEPFLLGEDTLMVRFVPGHSPGSIAFYYPEGNWAIAGDALFNGSIGRTDLPGGDFNTLINSIRNELLTLPDDTIIYPGHGPATAIGREKTYNPFLQ